jgi:hypothetical protein
MITDHVPAVVFLLITRMAAWLRLSRGEEAWKTAQILILCHQLAVLQRRQPHRPKLNWADRALIATLLSVISRARRHGLRLLVTPGNDPELARWHGRPPLGRQVYARQDRPPGRPPEHPGPDPPTGPGKSQMEVSQDPRRNDRTGRQSRSVDRVSDPEGQRH